MYKCKVMSKIVSEKNALRKRGKFKNIRVHTLLIVCSSFYSIWCQLGSLHVHCTVLYTHNFGKYAICLFVVKCDTSKLLFIING